MAFPFNTISENLTNLNTGSFYAENDLAVFNLSRSTDTFFGNSSQDIIEFSVFDIAGNLQHWNIVPKNDTYSVLNGNYVDVHQKTGSYNYYQFNSSYTISSGRQILLNTLNDLNAASIMSGSQVVSYSFLRNVAGNNANPLIIKSVSLDRKEVQLVPNFTLDATNPESVLLNNYYLGFCTGDVLLGDILRQLIDALAGFNAVPYYTKFSTANPCAFTTFKKLFGFTSDSGIINFFNRTYASILNYITNWLYTNYNKVIRLADLRAAVADIVNTALQFNLVKLNNNYLNLDASGSVNSITQAIYYVDFINPALSTAYNAYTSKYFSFLKNALNFGNNQFYPILNRTCLTGSADTLPTLVVKLFDYLPQSIGLRSTCWVSNIANVPVIQKVILSQPVVKTRYKIAGPNFNINPKIKNSSVKKSLDYTNKNQLSSTSTLNNQITFNKTLQTLSVDYTKFSNFTLFSSAQLRVKLFINKLNELNSLNQSLATLQNFTGSNYAISASLAYDSTSIQSQITNLYQSLDGYEAYLYANPALLSGSNFQNYLNSAIQYDDLNRDSLVNNTPEYINSDDANADYLVFLSMVGHFFDNIYLYIQNFPTTQYLSNAASGSFVSTIASNLLEHFGWHPISSAENTSLPAYYLNNTQYSGSQSISQKQKMDIIWNRLLTNLPAIYKTKGTEESIRLLSNIYGIPASFLTIKEFGNNATSTQDSSSYSFQNRYYFTHYRGSNEYVNLPPNPNLQSIEFKFAFDKTRIYQQNDQIFLLYRDNDFSVYVTKNQADWMGQVTFQLHDQALTTNALPIFNGNIFNVLIQQQPAPGVYTGQLPVLYYLEVNSVENDRIIFEESAEALLNSTYTSYFANSINAFAFGNSPASQNNFYGNIDKINLWNSVVPHAAFLDHCKNFDAYDDYDPANTYTNLYYRYSFEYPQNLAASQSLAIPNANALYNLSASAVNFPTTLLYDAQACQYYRGVTYPFQFTELDLTQNIRLSNFGPNKLKNSKINIVQQTARARLMPNELSTTPLDVTNDSNLVAACVSPFSTRDADILNFLGNYDIMNIVGDPGYLYSSSYDDLDQLRSEYNNYNLAEPVLYQEFFTIYKNYIDSSFFDSLRQLVPARSKLLTGTLIESSILERNKYQNKPVQAQNIDILSTSPGGPLYSLTATNLPVLTGSLTITDQKNKNFYQLDILTQCITNNEVDERLSVLSINGGIFKYRKNSGYAAQYIIKTPKPTYYASYSKLNSAISYITGSTYTYNFTENPSYFSGSMLDTVLYPVGHYALNTRRSGRPFLTTSNNTINSSGSLDGSLPAQLVYVNKNTSLKKLVSI
jgi:hypothetical protein